MTRRIIIGIFFIMPCIFLSGCSASKKADSDCQFIYGENIKNTAVIPFLIDKVGEDTVKYFNTENPVITSRGGVSRVVVSPTNRINDQMVMFENSYVFNFENCEGKLLEVFEIVRS